MHGEAFAFLHVIKFIIPKKALRRLKIMYLQLQPQYFHVNFLCWPSCKIHLILACMIYFVKKQKLALYSIQSLQKITTKNNPLT